MTAYSNAVKDYIERYKREINNGAIIDPHDLAAWAYRNGLHKPNPKTIIDLIAKDIAQIFREEYRTDKHGRRYRAKHAVTNKVIKLNLYGQIWMTLRLLMSIFKNPFPREDRR